ncbi:MAG: response regulator [Acidobacteria bacterium]|nr:response regulator [Acidobacteriota bacterium]
MNELILVVEDDQANAILLEAILTEIGGFEVATTDDGDEVLAAVDQGGPAAVLMDVSLTGTFVGGTKVDGPELTRRIRSRPRGANLPVILLSAHAMRGDPERYLFESGANDYLTKPILDHEEFIGRIRTQIESLKSAGQGGGGRLEGEPVP